jgi:hypothetical protein
MNHSLAPLIATISSLLTLHLFFIFVELRLVHYSCLIATALIAVSVLLGANALIFSCEKEFLAGTFKRFTSLL